MKTIVVLFALASVLQTACYTLKRDPNLLYEWQVSLEGDDYRGLALDDIQVTSFDDDLTFSLFGGHSANWRRPDYAVFGGYTSFHQYVTEGGVFTLGIKVGVGVAGHMILETDVTTRVSGTGGVNVNEGVVDASGGDIGIEDVNLGGDDPVLASGNLRADSRLDGGVWSGGSFLLRYELLLEFGPVHLSLGNVIDLRIAEQDPLRVFRAAMVGVTLPISSF
ncbi:MAG: hypothetical protein A3C90_04310 [Candidatus Magasanikbacteria bacterium RIFCSPHIGHO2_02_FULL_51_14]|uniref:Uncharacterized protein n=1 Tax=Candidatus Magasanikbacteria bacterium RIFCSPHIGHO2_02_FULL_51_14 TaxID=1798683 RepID=A0A1F6MDB7_9BACT|nr:MAG: hypothetical protein A3C90_04310 [Candidatus Magasanikbacteria bacterium RIFCSPHIGHO2_02_FULL_51_14]